MRSLELSNVVESEGLKENQYQVPHGHSGREMLNVSFPSIVCSQEKTHAYALDSWHKDIDSCN